MLIKDFRPQQQREPIRELQACLWWSVVKSCMTVDHLWVSDFISKPCFHSKSASGVWPWTKRVWAIIKDQTQTGHELKQSTQTGALLSSYLILQTPNQNQSLSIGSAYEDEEKTRFCLSSCIIALNQISSLENIFQLLSGLISTCLSTDDNSKAAYVETSINTYWLLGAIEIVDICGYKNALLKH